MQDELEPGQPVQHFAFGGIANPAQSPFLRGVDRQFLEARQAELDEFEKQRLAYNDALTKWQTEVYNPYVEQVNAFNTAAQQYNTEVYNPYKTQVDAYNDALTKYNQEVYDPYAAQYAEYEKAVNAWNAGDRTSDYAGPAAPTLARSFDMTLPTQPKAFEMTAPTAPADFSMAAPVLPFKEEDVIAYQQSAAERARKDASNRAVAIDVVSNPDQFNFGSMSISNRFMAEGGPVEKEPMGQARKMMDDLSAPDDDAALMRMLEEITSKGKLSKDQVLEAVDRVSAAGRGGDELLAYLSPESMAVLKKMGGAGTINPATGLPEFKGGVIGRVARGVRRLFGRTSAPAQAAAPEQATSPSNYFAQSQPAFQGGTPGTISAPYNPLAMNQGPSPQNMIAVNPNLSPAMLGGQQNAGVMVDRLGNRIYAPGMVMPPGFAKGGQVDIDAMRALVDASNMADEEEGPTVDDYAGEAKRMLASIQPSGQTPKMSRTRLPATGGGAQTPKEMGMEAGSLTERQEFKPKKFKPKKAKSAQAELRALAKQYALKQRAAENQARGLMQNTLGAPTLEQPTLTKEGLSAKRFQKGGEAKKAEEVEGEDGPSASKLLRRLGLAVARGVPQVMAEQKTAAISRSPRLLDALKQYVGDAAPGGALNQEWTPENVRTAAEVGSMEPGVVGSALSAGLAVDDVRKGNYGDAALNALGVLPFVPSMAGIFAGKGAKTADIAKLALAEKMLKAGEDPAKVWKETGWGIGPDGKWRFEIPDNLARLNPSYADDLYHSVKGHGIKYDSPAPVNTVLQHQPLSSSYDLSKNTIGVQDRLGASQVGDATFVGKDAGQSELLHELQHAIQQREGFARGGGPDMAFRDPRMWGKEGAAGSDEARRMLAERMKQMKQAMPVEEYAQKAWGQKEVTKEVLDDYNKNYLPTLKNISPAIESDLQKTVASEWYRRLAGEAEARLTQSRMGLNAGQRAAKFPFDAKTFEEATGVPIDHLIYRYD